MTTKYFNVKQGITTGNILLDGITGNITANNANLGNALTANFFIGAGNNLSNIAGANVTGQVGNALISGTVYTNAQPNITSVGTLTSLNVTGIVDGGNFTTTGYANVGSLNVSGLSNLGNVGNVTITGGTNGYYLQTNGSGSLVWAAVPSGTGIANGNSNVNIPTANGNVNITAGGNTTMVVTNTGGNISGNFDITGNLSAGNITTTGATGNITGANNISANTFISIISTGTAPFTVTSTTQVANLNVATSGTAVAVTGASQGNITSVGTLTSLNVSGTVTAVAFTANTGIFTGDGFGLSNIAAANINGTVANANYSTYSGNALIAGTVYTNAQPNITSVGTLTSVTVTGNANVGNLNTTALVATGTGSFSGNLTMNNYHIVSLATPVNATDAATKQYVDDVAQGLHVHESSLAATPDTLANVTSGTVTYNNGASGVGANLVTTGSFNLIDGVNVQTFGTRILVKNEANAAHNGIYTWSNATVIIRADDFDTPTEMAGGDFTFVQQGTLYNDTGWVMTDPVTTVGTSPVTWIQFSGAGTYTAGTGLFLNGNQFNISNTAVTPASYGGGDAVATFTVNQQGQLTAASNTAITANAANLTGTTLNSSIVTSSLTTVGTLGNLSVTYDITSGNIYANSGTIGAANLTGTLTTNAQPNITSVGTLTSLSVTGTVSGGNLTTTGYANVGSLNVTGTSNLGNVGNVTITGGTNGYYLQTNGSGALVWAPISAGSGIANGNSNVNIPTANGNVNITAGGNTSLIITSTGANISGSLDVTGNLSAGNITTAGASGNITGANNISANTFTGSLTTAAQGNITSVGSLTGLTVSNATGVVNFTTTANVTLGAVSNLHISGGSANYVLQTDGAGNLSWAGISTSSISNGNSNVNIPTANGNVNITSAGNTTMVITGIGGNVSGNFDVTGTVTAGNITTTGATGNIAGANNISANTFTSLITTGTAPFIVTSTTQVANLNVATSGTAVAVTGAAQGNITSLGNLSSLNVIGNIDAGNITTAGTANVGTLIVTGATNFGNLTANYVALNGGLTSNRSNVVVSTNTVVDQFAPTTFRTAKYIISASGDDGYQSVETLLIHDGTTAYITIYGSICSNNTADIIELSSNINGVSGNVALYATGTSANLKVNLVSTYIKT